MRREPLFLRVACVTALLVVAVLSTSGCKNLLKKRGGDAGADASVLAAASSAPTAFTPSSLPTPTAPPDPLAPKDRALFERTKTEVLAIDDLVKKGVLSDPAKPGEIDAVQRCSTLEDNAERLEKLPDADGEIAKQLAEIKRLCSFEVPVLDGNAALKQASLPASQASHKLVCDIARKDFMKARSVKPNDRKVFDLGGRMNSVCNAP